MKQLLTIAATALLTACALRADDWPMLGGHPDRNSVSTEKNLPTVWSEENPKKKISRKNIKWIANLGNQCWNNPVVSGGRVFIGTNNGVPRDPAIKGDRDILMCFSVADGKFLWQAVHEKLYPMDRVKSEEEDYHDIGLTSTPCISGDRVYYLSNQAVVVCRSAADGKPIWLLDLRKEYGVVPFQASPPAPLVMDDLVFTVTGNGAHGNPAKVDNPETPSFIALNAKTGEVAWKNSSPGDRIFGGQWGSPAYGVADGQSQIAFPGGDGWLYSFEPKTGKLLWKFNCLSYLKTDPKGKLEDRNTLVAPPVFAGHRVLISVGLDVDTGSPPGCLWAIDARKRGDITKEGELWRVTKAARAKKDEEFGRSIAGVAVDEGLVYAVEQQGYLNCIELESGKPIWSYDLLTSIWGAPVVADEKIYIRTGGEETFVFKTGREAKLIAKNILLGVNFGTVAVSDGVLYLAGGEGEGRKLYAIAQDK